MKYLVKIFMGLSLFVAGSASAETAWYGGTFSANIVMHHPTKPEQQAKGKLYVGKHALRAEGTVGGETRVLLMDIKKQQILSLNPSKKSYQDGPGAAPMPPRPDLTVMPDNKAHPLCGNPKLGSCKKQGETTIGGVKAEEWLLTMPRGPQTWTMQVWVDPERKIVLKHVTKQGPAMERKLLEITELNGRKTEKWQITQSYRGKSKSSLQWVDAKLRLPVKVENNGKVSAELTNLKEGPQPAKLFTLPKGYKKVTAKRSKPLGGHQQAPKGMQFH
uniref:DUF4412 domain-containing protein n=1 Tax=Magnetococcus massalia (strain MO-1) TaxID=451514 RepID=A0A1S7LLD6_MAGMO|nr:conserved exported protein of unknown function [Candidatus Magnetococcus massalia]